MRRLVDELKARVLLSGVIGQSVALKKSGHEYAACCPFHAERTPSFFVNDAKGFAHCFGCGWHGDAITFVMASRGCGFRDAYTMLANEDLPTWTPQQRAKAEAEDRLADLEKEQAARRFWKEAVPIEGTPAETYLRARGISIALSADAVRFGEVPAWQDRDTKEWGPRRPALLCACTDATDSVVGMQRIFFVNDDPRRGRSDKKRSLGTIRGSAVKLGPAAATIILPEGPEDGMSIMQEGPGFPVWVPLGTSMMPFVSFPPIVKKVIVAGQNNTAGRVAFNKAALALVDRGLIVSQVWPAAHHDDWNDQLRAGLQ